MAAFPDLSNLDTEIDEPLSDAERVVFGLALLQVAIKGGNSRDDLYRRTEQILEQMRPLLQTES